jgi:lipopolysaccharide transport system ATP-binding protein
MTSAIEVHHLSKRYRLGMAPRHRTLRDQLSAAVRGTFRRGGQTDDGRTFWALNDVSFDVADGEILGVIGRNGAGKSTLLKILSRITTPTSGEVRLRGRVGSLLEVGTGFHPELSGRENIYLNGSILGLKRVEIERKFDEIVAFAEIGQFIDTAVKRYSSGMYVRLAFAVAAHLEPEILIVDEVLAVGDAAFQKRCIGKMSEVAKEGRTVLFVSHNMVAVERLCTRVIRLDRGRLVGDGHAAEQIGVYLQGAFELEKLCVWDDPDTAPGSPGVRLARAAVRADDGSDGAIFTVRTPLVLEFDYWNLEPGQRLNLSVHVIDQSEMTVFNTFPVHEPDWLGKPFPTGLFRSEVEIPSDLLNTGSYRITLLVVRDQGIILSRHENILGFEVHDHVESRTDWHGEWVGAVRPMLTWRTTQLQDRNVSKPLDDTNDDRTLPETK